jgi:hypothetical protein
MQSLAETRSKDAQRETRNTANHAKRDKCSPFDNKALAEAGVEQSKETSGKTCNSSTSGAFSGALDADLTIVVDAWGALTASARAKIVGIARKGTVGRH